MADHARYPGAVPANSPEAQNPNATIQVGSLTSKAASAFAPIKVPRASSKLIVDPDQDHKFEIDLSVLEPEDFVQASKATALPTDDIATAVGSTMDMYKALAKKAQDKVISNTALTNQYQNQQPLPEALPRRAGAQVEAASPSYPPLEIAFLPNSPPAAPAYSVGFEVPDFGVIEARYHAIVSQGQLIVLVYDTRHPGGKHFFPHVAPGGQAKQIKMVRENQLPVIISTQSVIFSIGRLEFCLLGLVEPEQSENFDEFFDEGGLQ